QTHAALNHILPALQQLGMPILIDITSGLRFAPGAQNAVVLYDYFLRAEKFLKKAQPDFILHLGGMPRSKPLNRFLQNSQSRYVLVNNLPFRQDPFHRVGLRFELSPERFCRILAQNGVNAASELLPVFLRAENRASAALDEWFNAQNKLSEPAILRSVLHNLPGENNLFLANSMPVRDADASGIFLPAANRIGVNYGVNGIDGTIASAVGFAAGNRQPTTAVLGDLAFFHDLNSLQLVRYSPVPVTLIVINNNGGGIFSFLPINRYEDVFTEYFGTPQNLDFKNAAGLFDLPYFAPRKMQDFRAVYKSAVASGKNSLIEVQSDRNENYAVHRELWELVTTQVAREIHEGTKI
ncbi:MAG TPA: 2-succinyl-5-enolpyruvyl-6-hydroxy-3-cyclohexene-1-carboxylate synthase, partial [Bacteroidetes bacterium]|nr:2-succinyl-5-enolpyruvyl-6-hydroxy-3-cyclohexene-1-carboxylate synthase [Bacteroidota bacterium]